MKLKWAAMLLVIGAIITTGGGAFISWHNAEVAEAARAVVTRELNVLRSQQPYADPPVTAPVTPAKGLAPTSRSKADTPKTTQPQTGIVTRMRKPAPKAGG